MQSFKDSTGKLWEVVVHVAAVRRVRRLVGIDLFKLAEDGFKNVHEVLGDPVTLVDVLYAVCKDEADKEKISDEEFGRRMAGDAIAEAGKALLDGLIDFFPDAKARQSLRKLMDKSRAIGQGALKIALDKAEATIARVNVEDEARTLAASLMNSPGSLGSTPDLSRSTN